MRAVADTNVVVSGLLWHGSPRRILDAARIGVIDLFTSAVLLIELEDVLGRKRFAGRLGDANVTPRELVMGYAALAAVVEPEAIAPVILDDPDDDAVLACAVAARSAVIASGDRHLLGLRERQGIRVLPVAEFLSELAA